MWKKPFRSDPVGAGRVEHLMRCASGEPAATRLLSESSPPGFASPMEPRSGGWPENSRGDVLLLKHVQFNLKALNERRLALRGQEAGARTVQKDVVDAGQV